MKLNIKPNVKLQQAWDTFVDVWQSRQTLGDQNKTRDEAAFLPAALEILENPPNPLARWLGWSLMALFGIAVLWAAIGKVNIVAVAEGKIVPSGKVKTIQPLEKGVVKSILVKDGQYVAQGAPLIELDRTMTGADQQRLTNELHQAKLELARNKALLALMQKGGSNTIPLPYTAPEDASANEAALQQQILQQEWLQYQSKLAGMNNALSSRKAEKQTSQEQINKLQATLPLITRRAEALKKLLASKMVPEMQYLELEEQRINQQQELAGEHSHQKQLISAIGEAEQQLQSITAQQQGELLGKIADNEHKAISFNEELTKATDINARQILYSPVNGMVQELKVTTIGGVVQEAEKLMNIVPQEDQLEVKTMLPNQDIGFVHKGDAAEIKVHTFPFTRYGVVDAVVINVSDDAIADEKLGLIYTVELRMAKSTMWVDDKEVHLLPGMAVTAEIKTGERRLMEYFLSPIKKYTQESVRER